MQSLCHLVTAGRGWDNDHKAARLPPATVIDVRSLAAAESPRSGVTLTARRVSLGALDRSARSTCSPESAGRLTVRVNDGPQLLAVRTAPDGLTIDLGALARFAAIWTVRLPTIPRNGTRIHSCAPSCGQ